MIIVSHSKYQIYVPTDIGYSPVLKDKTILYQGKVTSITFEIYKTIFRLFKEIDFSVSHYDLDKSNKKYNFLYVRQYIGEPKKILEILKTYKIIITYDGKA